MSNKLITAVIIVAAVFPFVAIAFELGRVADMLAVVVCLGLFVIFSVALVFASRVTPNEPDATIPPLQLPTTETTQARPEQARSGQTSPAGK